MNFQQLRAVREAARSGLNLTEAAATLRSTQPAISRQVRELEDELGIELFVRSGKRLVELTDGGKKALPIVERLVQDAESLRRLANEQKGPDTGCLTVAATHAHARYVLPQVLKDFRKNHPDVALHVHQGSLRHVAELVMKGDADLCVATEGLAQYRQLFHVPCYRFSYVVLVLPSHPLLELGRPVTLDDLARCPLVTFELGYNGRDDIDAAFASAGLAPNVVLGAMTADVIKTYVELEMGVGIATSIVWDETRDIGLRMIDTGHLFPIKTTRLAWMRSRWLPEVAFSFMEIFAPTLTRAVVEQAMNEG